MRASLVAGVLGGLALWGAASGVPTDRGVMVALACWLAAGVAVAGAVRVALRSAAPSIGPAGAWVAGSVAVAWAEGWDLCPSLASYERSGPALAIWILAGALILLSLDRDPAPLGVRGIPARALVGWGLAYGVMWCLVWVVLLPGVRMLPEPLRVALGLSLIAGAAAALAGSAFVGPSETVPQGVALLLSQAGFTATVPDLRRMLWRLVTEGPSGSEELVEVLLVLAVAGSGWIVGAVAVWLRARHLARQR